MHTSDLYRELNLLKVPLIQNVQIASIVFKHKLNSLPPIFINYFTCSIEIHTYATLNTIKLHVKQPLNDNGKINHKLPWGSHLEHAARISDYITIFTFFQKEFEKILPKLAKLPMIIILVYIILTYCIAHMGVDCPKGNSLLTLNCSNN